MLFITRRRKREKNDNKEIVHKWFTLGISGEIYDKSLFESFCSIKKEDLIGLGKELKIVTMDEFRWSEGLYIRYLFLTGNLKWLGICF